MLTSMLSFLPVPSIVCVGQCQGCCDCVVLLVPVAANKADVSSLSHQQTPVAVQDIVSEHPERFFVAEILREKIFLQYKQEVPYACQVSVKSASKTAH